MLNFAEQAFRRKNYETFGCFVALSATDVDNFHISLINHQKQPLEVFFKKGALRNFAKFTEKHLCQSLFFNKVYEKYLKTLLKKILWHRRFTVNFARFLRTPFLQNASGQLLLNHSRSFTLQCTPTTNILNKEMF